MNQNFASIWNFIPPAGTPVFLCMVCKAPGVWAICNRQSLLCNDRYTRYACYAHIGEVTNTVKALPSARQIQPIKVEGWIVE